MIAQAEFTRKRVAPACDTTFGSWESITPGRRIHFPKHEHPAFGRYADVDLLVLDILEKGKPVVRPGRKAMGHQAARFSDRQATEGMLNAETLSRAIGVQLSDSGQGAVSCLLKSTVYRLSDTASAYTADASLGRFPRITHATAGKLGLRMADSLVRWPLEGHMKRWINSVRSFLVSEDGPTAVEYAVMLALIVVVCLAAIGSIGTNANTTFTTIANSLSSGT